MNGISQSLNLKPQPRDSDLLGCTAFGSHDCLNLELPLAGFSYLLLLYYLFIEAIDIVCFHSFRGLGDFQLK